MKGEPVVLVDKDSATHSRPWEVDPRFIVAIDRTHSDLVKFERYSDDYEHVLACIRLLLENATDIVSRRFNPEHFHAST
jgi:protein SERAC1